VTLPLWRVFAGLLFPFLAVVSYALVYYHAGAMVSSAALKSRARRDQL